MAQAIDYASAIERVEELLEEGRNDEEIFNYFADLGFTKKQIFNLFTQSGLVGSGTQVYQEANNPIEEALGGLLSIGIKYGIPLILIAFGMAYVGNELTRDFAVGIRSAAAVIMPLAVTMAFAKSDMRGTANDFLTGNKVIAFGFAFALAMVATAGAMALREFNNVVPIGELAFSTTLSLMIFGNANDGEVPMIHVGAVSGLLSYIVFFGIPLAS